LTAQGAVVYFFMRMSGMVSATVQHALRALVLLATLPAGGRLRTRELASLTRTPLNYLAKILVQLEHAGLVEARRGKNGGYRLAERPEEVSIERVVHVLEGAKEPTSCLLANFKSCSDEDGCPVHQRFRAVRQAWLEFVRSTTLADILAQWEARDPQTLFAQREES